VLLFQVRCHSQTPQFRAELCFDHEAVTDWSHFCCKLILIFILICSLQLFLMVVGGGGNVVEIHDRYFSRQKCNCGRLCATVWVFVGVKWESGTPVLHLLLIVLLRHCLPSLRHVSYTASQLSVTAGGTAFVSAIMDSLTTPSITVGVLWHVDAHKYDRAHMDAC